MKVAQMEHLKCCWNGVYINNGITMLMESTLTRRKERTAGKSKIKLGEKF